MKDNFDAMTFRRDVFRFGQRPLIVFLAFLNAFVPISTDLYLPALPRMTEIFACDRAIAEFTLSGFMLFFALSMLLWGAFSDAYGRKIILTTGLGIYAVGSIVCIGSQTIHMLIAGRLLQAIGSGAVCSVSMAIVKDTFKGRTMETVLAWIQSMTVICPMIAPMLGSTLMRFMSWRGLFGLLLLCSLTALLLSLALKETMKDTNGVKGLDSLKRIPFVLRCSGLRWLLLLFSLSIMPFMAYLTSSAFIYIKFYGLSEEKFSLFFAANACCGMLGPLLYIRLFRSFNRRYFLSAVFTIMALSGLCLYLMGNRGPFWFIGFYLPLTLAASSSRPIGTTLIMSQLDTDNGTVASLLGSCALMCGGVSMMLCSFEFANPVLPVAYMAMSIGSICLMLWLYLDVGKRYRSPQL